MTHSHESFCSNKELEDFQALIDYYFKDIKWLEEALTHKSFVHEQKEDSAGCDQQRLEFLGDALLGMIISEYLYLRFPGCPEGELSKMKSGVVKGTFLARKAKELNLNDYLFLGKGEESAGGRNRISLLADTFEALIASVYLDGGIPACKRFVLERFKPELDGLENKKSETEDYKSILQEYTQAKYQQVPVYEVITSRGPAHQRTFEVTVSLQEDIYGIGEGTTKKRAEQRAARQALEKLKKTK